jgi:hypothetical protein
MWNKIKARKITILALFAGFAYAFLIFSSFAEGWDDFRRGWQEGGQSAEYNKWGDVIRYKPNEAESYNLMVKAKKGFNSYPDSILNLKTNVAVQTKYSEMVVLGPKSDSTKISFLLKIILFIIGSAIFVALIRIPIHFYKLIGQIKNDFIFELRSVNLLRWLGAELLFIYSAGYLCLYQIYLETCSLFNFINYEIVMPVMDPIWLLLGIVSFLLAEILSKAMLLKEEQELTI